MRAASLGLAGVLSLLSADAGAATEGERERIVLDYSAVETCPAVDELLRRIGSYTKRWTLAEPGEAARRFVVRIGRREHHFAGRLDLREASGEAATREIAADDCEDVVLGMAIAIAIAVDPRSALGPAPPDDETPSDPPAEAAPQEAPAPLAERPRRPPKRPARTPPRLPPPLVASIGARGEANSAVSGLLAVVDLYVEAEWAAPAARLPWLRPVLRAGMRKSFTRTSRVGQAEASIDWTAGYIEACPSRFSFAPRLSVEGCLGSNIGVLAAEARDIPAAGTTHRLWFDYGVVAAARWQVHSDLFVETTAAVWLPLTRDRLRVEPDGVVTEAPGVGFSAGIGGGWQF